MTLPLPNIQHVVLLMLRIVPSITCWEHFIRPPLILTAAVFRAVGLIPQLQDQRQQPGMRRREALLRTSPFLIRRKAL